MITNGHQLAPPMHGPCDPGQDKHSSEINLLVGTVVSCTTLRPRPTLLAIADDVVEQRRLRRCSSQELALQEGPSRFAIFDTFDDDTGRNAHLNGKVAVALMEKAKTGDLFAKAPEIHRIAVLADKLPH